jgi:chorismate dehydratase
MKMATTSTKSGASTVIGRIPYTNCIPFFHGLPEEGWQWTDVSPRELGQQAKEGSLMAGPLPLADFLRLKESFERLGPLGVAVRARCGSVMLFSRKPARQLDGTTIAVTEATSTSALLLRLILEQHLHVKPKEYRRGVASEDADGVLLIGDEAMQFRVTNREFPYETDLAFEWWLWQHLPFVFAVWAVRKDTPAAEKQRLSRLLQHQLAVNHGRLAELANERAESLGLPAEEIERYLASFIYRLSEPEEQGIAQFERLTHEHRLL